MAKISNPILFSQYFKIDPLVLDNLGVFNPLLNVDAKLFIDPLLLGKSSHSEMNTDALNRYNNFFHTLIKLLRVSKLEVDVPWRNATQHFLMHEIKGTCLGYSATSIHGNAWGETLQQKTLRTAKEIIDLGIDDPDLFIVLTLLEEGIGPDRISDMVTNIILQDLIKFNERININLSLPQEEFNIHGNIYSLIRNPLENKPTPIILVPLDILRNLPIACDWDEVCDAAYENDILRKQVSQQIGEIWQLKTKNYKKELRLNALSSREAFLTLLDVIKEVNDNPYDFAVDKEGEITWKKLLEKDNLVTKYPLNLSISNNPTLDEVFELVKQIIEHFRNLIEHKGLWKELWANGKNRPEKSAQRIFFAVADTYCKANNLDITPEADSGNGPVDFKFSNSYKNRVLVEIKLSTSTKLLHGYKKQLQAYKEAEETMKAIYLIIDIGNMKNKDQEIFKLKNKATSEGLTMSDIIIIDGTKKLSASNR